MNAMTRSTTSCGPATWRHFSWWVRPSGTTVDLNSLQRLGVRFVGRLAGVTDAGIAQFSGSLPNQCALADLKLGRLLDTLDGLGDRGGVGQEAEPPERFPPTDVPPARPSCFLFAGEIKTVMWATGTGPIIPGCTCRSSTKGEGSPRRRRDGRARACT